MSLDRTKLARVIALLASDQPGERDAAVLAATRMLKAAGMRWEELAQDVPPTMPEATQAALDAAMERVRFWKGQAEQANRVADGLRTSSQTWGKRCVAFERRVADLEARLEISQRENAKLRKALGPDGAARAVFAGTDNEAVRAMQESAS